MTAQTIFLMWMTMITAIYGITILWLVKTMMDMNKQIQYLYWYLEKGQYETQMEYEYS